MRGPTSVGRRRRTAPEERGQAVVEFVLALWSMMLLMLFMILLFSFAQDVFSSLNRTRRDMLADYRQEEQWDIPPCTPFVSRQWSNAEAVRVGFRELPFMRRFTPTEEYVRLADGSRRDPAGDCFMGYADAVRIRGATQPDISVNSLIEQIANAFPGHQNIPIDALEYGLDCVLGGVLALTMSRSKNKLADVVDYRMSSVLSGIACVLVSGMQELGELTPSTEIPPPF